MLQNIAPSPRPPPVMPSKPPNYKRIFVDLTINGQPIEGD